jgi:hypothetical protein
MHHPKIPPPSVPAAQLKELGAMDIETFKSFLPIV